MIKILGFESRIKHLPQVFMNGLRRGIYIAAYSNEYDCIKKSPYITFEGYYETKLVDRTYF